MSDAAAVEQDRLRSFAAALDDLKRRTEDQLGDEDLQRVKHLQTLSRTLEVAGRTLIHFSLEPVSFTVGVLALWSHKQLQATELGHSILHGCYDRIEGAERFRSTVWRWDLPIDEEAWHLGHNLRHHTHTNIAGKDQDVNFGPTRLTGDTPHRWYHYVQLPYSLLLNWPNFAWGMNAHFTGLLDLARPRMDVLPDRSTRSIRRALRMSFRKYLPYYAYNYGLFPALAGPLWWKVLLGNWMAEKGRDLYSAASIYCGHIGAEVDSWEEGARPGGGKAGWYERQVRASQNFEVPYVLSVFCGALDYQIEHHLFPKLPPERLRQIAPEVRRICEEHGVPYKTGPWHEVLGGALRHLWTLSFPTPAPA